MYTVYSSIHKYTLYIGVQRNCGSNNVDTKPCALPLKRFTVTLGSIRFFIFLSYLKM